CAWLAPPIKNKITHTKKTTPTEGPPPQILNISTTFFLPPLFVFCAPSFAAVLSAEHLAIARREVDLLGVAVMQADRHQRAVRRHLVETLPALTEVLAAVERAVFRCGRDAQTSIERVRILRRNLDIAPVGERREAVDPHVLPAAALILAAEQPHAHGDDDAVGVGGAGADRVP